MRARTLFIALAGKAIGGRREGREGAPHERPAPDAVALLESLSSVALELEGELDVSGFANLVDLYARLLEGTPPDRAVPAFEDFVHDGEALRRAAVLAERESGMPSTGMPVPPCRSDARRR